MNMNLNFTQRGNIFNQQSAQSTIVHEKLPVGNYVLKQNLFGFYLEQLESFKEEGKVYGSMPKTVNRILKTFASRPNSTGVLLSGYRGTGKSMTARQVSIEGGKIGYPTILINEPFSGDEFNEYISSITQPIIILFDEFEKTYNPEVPETKVSQEKLLSLLDGLYPSKKLFLFTVNYTGRIFYHIEYPSLDQNFIRDYCIDKLNNVSYIENIVELSTMYIEFTFDILKAIVEEMNRYDEGPFEAVDILNGKPDFNISRLYTTTMKIDGIKSYDHSHSDVRCNIRELISQWNVTIYNQEGGEVCTVTFESEDRKKLSIKDGVCVYEKTINGKVHTFEFNMSKSNEKASFLSMLQQIAST